MHALFLALAGVGSGYFLWRRRIDPMSIAFASCLVYFVPGLLGFARFPYGDGRNEYFEAIAPGAHGVMALVLATVVAAAVALDRIPLSRPPVRLPLEAAPGVFLAMTLGAGAISAFTVGPFYLCLDKQQMLARIDQWYYYAAYALPFCLVTAAVARQWGIAALATALLAFDVFIGFRANAAVVFLALAALGGGMFFAGVRSAAKYLALVLIGAFAIFFVKQAVYTLKYAADPVCQSALVREARQQGAPPPMRPEGPPASAQIAHFANMLATGGPLLDALTHSESFVIQAILNEVVRQDFSTEPDYLVRQILSGVPGGASVFGLDQTGIPTFESLYHPALFPKVTGFGMANNPWAQAYAAGGFGMVAAFAIGYAGLLGLLSLAYWQTEGVLRGCLVVVAVWLGFYFHRNDLLIEIGILKQVAYTMAAGLMLAAAISYTMPSSERPLPVSI